MKSGNATIFNHRQERRILRLFQGVRGVVEYLGEFQLDAKKPFYNTDASEANDGPVRSAQLDWRVNGIILNGRDSAGSFLP